MKQAVILAAGEGQRLRPFTVNKPKVMISIAGKPVLQYVVEALVKSGIHDIVIVVGYRREQIFDYLGTGEKFNANIVYITQEKQLGTAHALAQVRGVVEGEFLVLPGDNLIEFSTIASFVNVKPNTVLVKKIMNHARYGVVNTEGDVVKAVIEKPEDTNNDISTVNTGIYAFNSEVFNFINDNLGIPDVINNMIGQNHTVSAQETGGTWLDIVYPWDILELNDIVLHWLQSDLGGTVESGAFIKGMVVVGKNTVIRSNSYIRGPVVIGENCDIGPNIHIMPATSIGNNVVISAFSEIKNSVIGDDVSIEANSIIQDSVIDKGCVIKGHFSACSEQTDIRINDEYHSVNVGAIIGVGCNMGNNVVAKPGVIVGNYSRINSLKLISGKLPDKSIVM